MNLKPIVTSIALLLVAPSFAQLSNREIEDVFNQSWIMEKGIKQSESRIFYEIEKKRGKEQTRKKSTYHKGIMLFEGACIDAENDSRLVINISSDSKLKYIYTLDPETSLVLSKTTPNVRFFYFYSNDNKMEKVVYENMGWRKNKFPTGDTFIRKNALTKYFYDEEGKLTHTIEYPVDDAIPDSYADVDRLQPNLSREVSRTSFTYNEAEETITVKKQMLYVNTALNETRVTVVYLHNGLPFMTRWEFEDDKAFNYVFSRNYFFGFE